MDVTIHWFESEAKQGGRGRGPYIHPQASVTPVPAQPSLTLSQDLIEGFRDYRL